MDRQDFADAIVTFATYRDHALIERLRAGNVADISNESLYPKTRVGRRRYATTERQAVENLEGGAAALYILIVAKRCGEDEALKLANEIVRINDPAGVTIYLQNSDDDPTMINVHIQDEIASEWVDAHGSLEGSTWEQADGPEFQYDSFYWRPGIIEELHKKGFDLDMSEYGEPDERDVKIAEHSGECGECEYDWHEAEKHMIATGLLPKSFRLHSSDGRFFGRYEGFTANEALDAAKASEWNKHRDFDGVTAEECEP